MRYACWREDRPRAAERRAEAALVQKGIAKINKARSSAKRARRQEDHARLRDMDAKRRAKADAAWERGTTRQTTAHKLRWMASDLYARADQHGRATPLGQLADEIADQLLAVSERVGRGDL